MCIWGTRGRKAIHDDTTGCAVLTGVGECVHQSSCFFWGGGAVHAIRIISSLPSELFAECRGGTGWRPVSVRLAHSLPKRRRYGTVRTATRSLERSPENFKSRRPVCSCARAPPRPTPYLSEHALRPSCHARPSNFYHTFLEPLYKTAANPPTNPANNTAQPAALPMPSPTAPLSCCSGPSLPSLPPELLPPCPAKPVCTTLLPPAVALALWVALLVAEALPVKGCWAPHGWSARQLLAQPASPPQLETH